MSELTGGIDGYFLLTLATIVFGGIGLITKYAYKSKCSRVEICCLKIDRDIEVEEREDAISAMKGSPSIQLS
jgi:hypothetical protein